MSGLDKGPFGLAERRMLEALDHSEITLADGVTERRTVEVALITPRSGAKEGGFQIRMSVGGSSKRRKFEEGWSPSLFTILCWASDVAGINSEKIIRGAFAEMGEERRKAREARSGNG